MTAPEPAPAPPYEEMPPPSQPPKRRTGRIILIVLGAMFVALVLLIGGCFLLVNESTKDAQKVSDEFVAAVQAGDTAKAYSLTSPSFRAATSEADTAEFVKSISALVSKEPVSPTGKAINTSTDNGKIAVFTYKLKPAQGNGTVYFKTQIRDEQGRWQVMNFRSAETALNTDVE